MSFYNNTFEGTFVHGLVHRNHCKSTQQTRRRRARPEVDEGQEDRRDLGLMPEMGTE